MLGAGSVVVITGASAGIGRETAMALAPRKLRLALAARRAERLEQLAEEIRSRGSETLVVPTDVSDRQAVARLAAATVESFGRIDVLINNAGYGLFAAFADTAAEDLERIFRVNVFGAAALMREVLPIMLRQGSGHIVNISSVAGKRGLPYTSAYCATKFALNGLTESLRLELEGTGIRVSLVCPVGTATEFFEAGVNRLSTAPGPVGPVQTAEQVARAIVRCLDRPRAEVFPYPSSRFLGVVNALAPRLVDWLAGRWTAARRKQELTGPR